LVVYLEDPISVSIPLPISPYHLQNHRFYRTFARSGLTQNQAELPSASVRYWIGGSGAPLLLLQGFGACATWQWHGQARYFASKRRLIVPDLLYFGGSIPRHTEQSLERQAEVIVELLDHHNIDMVDVVGVSYGGFVALGLAQKWADRVNRVVLVDSPGIGYVESDYRSMLESLRIDHIGDLLLPDDPNDITRLLKVAWHRPPWTPSFVLPNIHKHMFCDRVTERRALLQDIIDRMRRADDDIDIPHRTLIAWGRHDPLFPVHLAQRMQSTMGHRACLHIFERSAHTPNMEQIRSFNQVVEGFLSH